LAKLDDLLEMGFLQPDEYEERKREVVLQFQQTKQSTPKSPEKQRVETIHTPSSPILVPQKVGKDEELWTNSQSVQEYNFSRGTMYATEQDLRWDSNNGACSKGLIVVDGGRTVINTSMQDGCLNICRATTTFSTGTHSWKIHLRNIPTGAPVVVGICYFDISLDMYVGSGNNGWGYLSTTGQKLYSNTVLKYTEQAFGNDDVIGVELDMDAKTLKFNFNGVDLGVAFKVSGRVFPAISLPGKTKAKGKGEALFPAASFVV